MEALSCDKQEKGWIMTNGHVSASGPAEIQVQFVHNKTRHEAKRLFVDSRHDIAILEVDPSVIPDGGGCTSIVTTR